MRKTYVGVELEILSFSTQDVVRTSDWGILADKDIDDIYGYKIM